MGDAPRCGHTEHGATGTWVCVAPPHAWASDPSGYKAAHVRRSGKVPKPHRHYYVQGAAVADR